MTREEAIRRLRYIRMDYLGYPPFLEPIDMAIEALSADAVDVNDVTIHYKPYPSANAKQGKWLTDKGKSLMICSVCGTLFNKHTDFFDFEEFANFCPYCGAIMKGGAE